MKVVIISQARMTSTRLPGKVLKKIFGKPLLQYQIERLRNLHNVSEFIVATTINDADDAIEELCHELSCPVFRGSEHDVLGRYYHAAKEHGADVIVRVTSDCPIIDKNVVSRVIDVYMKNSEKYDYVSNTLERTYPRGMDAEVFSFSVLEEAYHEGILDVEREHVTPFFYSRPNRYRLRNVSYLTNCSTHRWTVDTPEDFALIEKIIHYFSLNRPDFTLEDALELLEKHPDWKDINALVEQKKLDR